MNRVLVMIAITAVGFTALFFIGQGYVRHRVPDALNRNTGTVMKASRLNEEGLDRLDDGKFTEAVSKFRAAMDLKPADEAIAHNLSLGLARMAVARSDLGDVKAASEYLGEALDVWPENPEALRTMALIHYRSGRYVESRDLALRLNAFYPGSEDVEEFIAHLQTVIEESEGMVSEDGHHFRLLYSGDRRLEFEGEFLSLLQDEMDSLTAIMGYFPSNVIDVLLMTGDLGLRAVPLDPSLTGLYDGKIRVYLDEIENLEGVRKTVRHEMVHALLHRVGGVLPGWFQEGMAQFLGERYLEGEDPRLRVYLRTRLDEGYGLDLTGLGISFVDLPDEGRTAAYASSYLFMEYLVQKYGENLIPIIIGELEGGQGLIPALRELTGRDLTTLQVEFVESIRKGG